MLFFVNISETFKMYLQQKNDFLDFLISNIFSSKVFGQNICPKIW